MKVILLFLLKLHIAGVITGFITTLLVLIRMRRLITEYKILSGYKLIKYYSILNLLSLVPILNLVWGLACIINSFIITDEEFIEDYTNKK